MKMTDEQIESLAGFVLEIMDDWPELGSIDGFDLQDIAEKHKILIPQTVYAPCGESCNCAECYTDEEMQKGVTCYHMADWLVRDAQQRNAPDQPEQNGASLLATWDNGKDGGMDADELKKRLRGKTGWLTIRDFANGQAQLFLAPHSKRSGGG